MEQVGIRELREQASEILRRVREDGEAFEVTYHGHVVAKLTPVADGERHQDLKEFWLKTDELSAKIGAEWPKGLTAVQALREDRDRV